jgi:hypothetical protein
LVNLNDQDNVGEVCNICSLPCLYTWNSKKTFINCLVSAYIALWLDDNHGDQQKSTRPEEAGGGPVGYHRF